MLSRFGWMKPYWRTILTVIVPIIFSPIPLALPFKAARCGYVILIMAAYWMTEAIPLAITALIPVFAFPLLGVLSTGECCLVYMKETNMMFLGGLTVAIAVEHCNLHKRIALFVILHVGQSPRRLMAGFMLTTMFLSMWISNTASTAMMVPIVDAILAELYTTRDKKDDGATAIDMGATANPQNEMELAPTVTKNGTPEAHIEGDKAEKDQKSNDSEIETKPASLTTIPPDDECKALRDMCFLATAYSANLGGTGSLTGTGPNLVIKGILSSSFSEPSGLNFATWMAFNVPGMILCVVLAWVWLQFLFMGLCRKNGRIQESSPERMTAVKKLIRRKYEDLGPMTHHEATVLTLFIILVLLWLFRAPEFVAGWASWFSNVFTDIEVDDATPAMFIVFLLFVLPAKLDFWWFRDPNSTEKPKPSPACMTWQVVQEKIPWGVVLLLGGGFAMAEGANKSGLNKWLGYQFETFDVMPKEAIVFVICLLTAMLTEVASNTATASILLPVLKEMALNINVNPLYLMLPATICCSYAFMLPVATPPNAIVFGAANMRSIDMMKAGFFMNIICVCVMTLMINTLGVAMFDLHSMPPWTNSTKTISSF